MEEITIYHNSYLGQRKKEGCHCIGLQQEERDGQLARRDMPPQQGEEQQQQRGLF